MIEDQNKQHILQKDTLLYNGKYRIDGVIEQGGMGITYKATLVQLDAPIAIKELFLEGKCLREPDNSLSLQFFSEKRFTSFKEKFINEGRTLAKFKHPNLVQVRDILEENNTVYLVMDYVDEQTLEAYVKQKGALNESEALSYILQIASVLQSVHHKDLLHKDIQPSNIVVTSEGKAVLVGLGVAGQFNKASQNPNYAPMEQYIAQYTKKDNSGPYTDIYALAATLYYAITGNHPLSAVQRQNEELPPPKSINTQISTKTNQALLKAMSINTDNRHQTMEEFITAIRPLKNANEINPDALSKGTRLLDGKYRIESTVGQSGLGITYKATLLKLDMSVVIKELFLPGYCFREDDNSLSIQALNEKAYNRFKKQFLQEGKILAKSTHPNIIKVKDLIKENNTVYLVMDDIKGTDLQTYVNKKGKLKETEALYYTHQIADALSEIHHQKFLHKDVRPTNIIITKQKQVVLTGLGVAKDKVKNSKDESEAGYFPMEQYASNAQLTAPTDVYSLAATLYFMLTGERPTSAFDHYYTALKPPQNHEPSISRRTNDAIMKAMRMKAAERYQNVTDFAEDLEEIDPNILRQKRIRQVMGVAAMLAVALLALFLVTRPPTPPTVAANEYDSYLKVAKELSEHGHYKKADLYYQGLLETRPNDDIALAGQKYAQTAQLINKKWWNSLDEEWKSVFRKKADFKGKPNSRNLNDIFKLTELHCYDTKIESLAPVEHLINLKTVGCYNTNIKDLAPLQNLQQLTHLDCSSTAVSSLDPIKELRNLQVLDCTKTLITSLEPIRQLRNLKELYCSKNQVTTLQPLQDLTSLTKLYCAKMPISNLEPIKNLTNLRELYAYGTQISDLSPIKGLTNLHTLHCYKSKIASLEPIKNLTNLHTLHCYNNQIKDLSAISGLTNLRVLHTQSTPIETLDPIRNLTNLVELKCFNTSIKSLEPLADLSNLKELYCSKTKIEDLEAISNLTNLNKLHFANTQVNNLDRITNLKNLHTLYISGTQITDLSPLKNLKNLNQLYCANLQVNDLEAVTNLNNLSKIDCSSTQVSDLTPLHNLSNLVQINCSSTQINNLEPLKNLINLQDIDCSSTQVSSLAPLDNLNNLQSLKCDGTNVNPKNLEEFKKLHADVLEK